MRLAKRRVVAAFVAVASAAAVAGCPDPEVVVEQRTAVEHGADLAEDPKVGGANGINQLACVDCHTETSEAGGASVPTGGPLAGATKRTAYWGGQELSLLSSINDCRYYFMLADAPWTGDEDEAKAIYAYLESLDGPADAVPFTIAEVVEPGPGDAKKGEATYARACASCHGAIHSGVGAKLDRAPVLPDDTLAEHPLGDYTAAERRLVFVEKVRHGTFAGYGGQMPPFSKELLSDGDMADILSYLEVP
jgi:thiosulfate dehydrogenase